MRPLLHRLLNPKTAQTFRNQRMFGQKIVFNKSARLRTSDNAPNSLLGFAAKVTRHEAKHDGNSLAARPSGIPQHF